VPEHAHRKAVRSSLAGRGTRRRSCSRPDRTSPAQTSEAGACTAWRVEYVANVNLKVSDTPLGAGDGVYEVGPGTIVLRVENKDGQPGGRVDMLEYRTREHFTVVSKALLWKATVQTRTNTRATPDKCGVVGKGYLQANTLSWSGPIRGSRTDGTLHCEGSLCGMFGAPPKGTSEFHLPPRPVVFKPFRFGKDLKTFTMDYTFAARTESPKQTSHVALNAREVRRACVPVPACP
jgi:hypothetical protein